MSEPWEIGMVLYGGKQNRPWAAPLLTGIWLQGGVNGACPREAFINDLTNANGMNPGAQAFKLRSEGSAGLPHLFAVHDVSLARIRHDS